MGSGPDSTRIGSEHPGGLSIRAFLLDENFCFETVPIRR